MSKSLLAATALFALTVPAVAEGATTFPPSARPHSSVAIRPDTQLSVRRVMASVKRVGSSLRVTARATASSTTSTPRDAVIRIGRCTGGEPAFQTCPATYSKTVHLPGKGDNRSTTVTATIAQPPAGQDAIEVQVTAVGKQKAPLNAPGGYIPPGDLVLRGMAWRGPSAGREYGAEASTPDVLKILLDASASSATQFTVKDQTSIVWDGDESIGAQAVVSPCGRGTCTPKIKAFTLKANATTAFLDRPFFTRPKGATDVSLFLQLSDSDVGFALLPWPVKLPS